VCLAGPAIAGALLANRCLPLVVHEAAWNVSQAVEARVRDAAAALMNGSEVFRIQGWLAAQLPIFIREEAAKFTGDAAATFSESQPGLPTLLQVFPVPPTLFPGVNEFQEWTKTGWGVESLLRPLAVQGWTPSQPGTSGLSASSASAVGTVGEDVLYVQGVEQSLRGACLWAPLV
jgi:hypothetical protein